MATIRGVIQIQDQMSPAFRAMNNAMNICISSFENLQNVSSNTVDTASLRAAQKELQNAEIAINEVEENINRAKESQDNFNRSVQNGHSPMDSLIGKAKSLVGAYLGMQAVKGIINASDEIVQTKARLDLMNDGLQTTEQLQNMIFQSAQRSRGAYADTASAVAKMGILAKDAFSSNEETVAFVEQLNKQFTICGTDIAGAQAATLQLTQALASGVLRGEELNSVFEQAPTVIQAIADYLDVGIGEIRDMASEGQITADIVKKAMFAAADETNKKFESMPKTIGQIWQGIKNEALMAFQPVLLKINEVANNPGFSTLINNVSGVCSTIAIILLNIINLVCSVAQFFSDNWGIIEPIIWGIIAALGAYLVIMGLVNLANLASAISTGAASLAADIYAASLDMQAGATFVATASQYGLNAALLACPITWIIVAIIALIAIFYAAIGAVNKFAGTSLSVTGMICGAFMVAAAAIGNAIIAMANIIIDAFAAIYNFIAAFAEFFANVFNDPIGSVIRLFSSMADTVLEILEGIASAIDTLFGSNLAGVVSGWRDTLQGWTDDVAGEAKIKVERIDPSSLHFDRLNYGTAWNTGYGFGQNVENKVSNMFSTTNQNDVGGTPFDYQSLLDAAEGANQGAGDTAKNTGAMKDALDITEEDLKYMRDIAEQEVINRFTTAEIKVDMTNYNSVNSDLDIDGIVDTLAIKVEEQMNISAEGVHE